jgi:hypothetical protein
MDETGPEQEEGIEALKHRPPPGAKARLTAKISEERSYPSFWHKESTCSWL